MKIAFLTEHASPLALRGGEDAGGQNVYVDQVSRNLARLGYEVDVFTRRDASDTPTVVAWAPGVRVISLSAGPAVPLPKDNVWPHMPAFRDALLAFMEREEMHYDLVHANFWMSGWVAAQLKERLDVPVVHIFHAMGKTKQRHQGSADTSPHDRISVEHDVIRHADRLIAQCPSEESELVDDYGADPTRVVVIPSGVNVETFQPVPRDDARARIGLQTDAPVIVYVGRMLPRKDVRNVVRGLAALLQRARQEGHGGVAQTELLLVGGESTDPDPAATPEIGELQRLARELDVVERVHLVGRRQEADLKYYYSAGDVAVTTPWYEPFGLTPLEAMACGRPVVGSAVGGISFTVADGQTGFLVPPRDPRALSDRLYRILASPDVGTRMGRAARDRVEREFTWPTVAARTAALYRSLAGQDPALGKDRLSATG